MSIRLGDDDPPDSTAAGAERSTQADRASSNHQHAVLQGALQQADAVVADGDRLHQRAPFQWHRAVKRDRVARLHHETVGEGTGEVEHAAVQATFGAAVVLAGGAEPACAAGHRGIDGNPVTHRRRCYGAAAIHHHPGGLVTHDHARYAALVRPGEAVHVRSADASRLRAHPNLSRAKRLFLTLDHPQPAWPFEHQGATAHDDHPATTGFVRRPISSTSTVTSSPGASHSGGSRNAATPAGVPVVMRSPGSSVIVRVTNSINVGTSNSQVSVAPY